MLLIVASVIIGLLIVIAAFLVAYVVGSRDVVSAVDVVNTGGDKTALLVYQPGASSQTKDVSYAFADGLASRGWRIEITTASSESPSDMSNYSLLVLAWPIYGGAAGKATVRYVDRIDDLQGIQTVLIAVGGDAGVGFDNMTERVQTSNGVVIKSVAPKEMFNINAAADIARQAGAEIFP